jgi:uncharacterized membrane protein
MFNVPVIRWLLIVWGAITGIFVVLLIWRSLVGMREEDQIFLDEVEQGLADEQRQIVAKVRRITTYAKGFGIASAGLLLLILGFSIYGALAASNRPTALP